MTAVEDLRASPRSPARPVRTTALLAVLLVAQLMAILDVNIVNVAAATIRTDLHTSGAGLQLVIAGYLTAYAILLITGARLGGRLGYRRAFLAGLAVFTVASLGCGLAPNAATLIGFRFLQGGGAALMIPQVFSLIQRHFTGDARVRALGRYAAVISGGLVIGQILGGVLVTANLWGTGWRPVFFVNVPVGVVLLALGAQLLPPDDARSGRRLDVWGLAVLAVAVLAFIVPLVFGRAAGWPAWCYLSLGVSIALFVVFAAVQRRAAEPLMPGRLFRAPGLLPTLAAIFLTMCSYGGYLFSMALHLQSGLHYSSLHAGLTFVPMATCFAIASLNGRRIPPRWHRPMIPAGILLATVSLVVLAAALHRSGTPGAWFYLAQILFGLSSGAVFAPLVAAALAGVRPADAADASGVITTALQLAQVVGLATIGSLYLALVGGHGSADAVASTLLVEAAAGLLATGCAMLNLRRPRSPVASGGFAATGTDSNDRPDGTRLENAV